METKTIGIIALVVIAVGLLFFSFKKSFMNEPRPAGAEQAAQMKASMEKAIADQKAKETPQGQVERRVQGNPAPSNARMV